MLTSFNLPSPISLTTVVALASRLRRMGFSNLRLNSDAVPIGWRKISVCCCVTPTRTGDNASRERGREYEWEHTE